MVWSVKGLKRRGIKSSTTDRAYMTFVYSFLGLFILAVVYPLVYVLSCSFSSPGALISGKVFLLPVDFSVMGYRAVFKSIQVWIGYRNTILYTSVYTVMSVFITMMVAFPLSRSEFPAKKAITWLFTVTMFISGGLIPNYLLVKYASWTRCGP
jgi:putative aldouronate transport system permease protein